MNYSLVGEQIRKYRRRKGLTQQQLGKQVGVTWEMVSRYERGASSPMTKITEIADALSVSVIELFTNEENTLYDSSSATRVPLFVSIPSRFDFGSKVGYYYAAPEWIKQTDDSAFAIDPNIVETKSVQISSMGPIYISPSYKISKSNLVLFRDGKSLVIDSFSKSIDPTTILGVVLAQERRFVE